tara:strand:- start:1062 stop:3278 length:2217 start_codon:yes stop_codon:yes gene_type:complete
MPSNTLFAYVGLSHASHATIKSLDLDAVRSAHGVVSVITADDIPGLKDIGPVIPGDPLITKSSVEFYGQVLFAVAATSQSDARRAARLARVEYDLLPADLDIEAGRKANSYVSPMHCQQKGNVDFAIDNAPFSLEGKFASGGQEQMYLEGQVSIAIPQEDGNMLIHTSSQNPSEGQKLVAEVLGIDHSRVTVEVRRMGGGFGGKETHANQWACLAAVFANETKRPVRMRLARADDFSSTGKRHPFESQYRVGFDKEGRIRGLDVDLYGGCGMSADLSNAIVDRAMFHIDNCYYLPAVRVRGYRVKTHTVSNTAFRGFGGPQGILAIENIIEQIATATGIDPLKVRERNFYTDEGNRNRTHYAQTIEQHIIEPLVTRLTETSDYYERRKDIRKFNVDNDVLKRGISLTPVKFGISFTMQHMNQAGALLHIYTDGSIQLNHGGTEMGQGLYTKVAQIVAREFSVELSRITCTATRTDKVPNTSPTAASSGSDLNGMAARDAATKLKKRLCDFAEKHFSTPRSSISFNNGQIIVGKEKYPFEDIIKLAYHHRVSLSATGYYRTPKIYYDRETATGRPFFYFAYGAAVAETIIDTLSGEYRILRVDICQDVGQSLNPAIDIGQIEGGFVQGMGWLTTEELKWEQTGRLASHGPATYKIPAVGDTPSEFNVELFPNSPNTEATIFHSKAVGEPPLVLGISAWTAIRDAIASIAEYRVSPILDAPATPEQVLAACDHLRSSRAL